MTKIENLERRLNAFLWIYGVVIIFLIVSSTMNNIHIDKLLNLNQNRIDLSEWEEECAEWIGNETIEIKKSETPINYFNDSYETLFSENRTNVTYSDKHSQEESFRLDKHIFMVEMEKKYNMTSTYIFDNYFDNYTQHSSNNKMKFDMNFRFRNETTEFLFNRVLLANCTKSILVKK